jgi:DtxR family transcriptional regulator, Mn-dependent transcriptional regulator
MDIRNLRYFLVSNQPFTIQPNNVLTQAEENYLKIIFKIIEKDASSVGTNAIAAKMQTSAASVTDMLKRLAEKELVQYEKYKGATLTEKGAKIATNLIRKHRLWEVFLVDKLGFAWDEVHEFAEELEHIQGDSLIARLDKYLNYPKYDPHGDPIPDAEGKWLHQKQVVLASLQLGEKGVISGVQDHSVAFLQYLNQMQLTLGTSIEIQSFFPYDQSVKLLVGDSKESILISEKVSKNLMVL